MEISLSEAALARLTRPVRGKGGFQQLLRKLQHGVHGAVLAVDDADHEKLSRYSHAYGAGGFQSRTGTVASEIQQTFDF
jgi:hypothetical protein